MQNVFSYACQDLLRPGLTYKMVIIEKAISIVVTYLNTCTCATTCGDRITENQQNEKDLH